MSTFPPRAELKSMGTRSTRTGLGETPSSPPHERADATPASKRIREGVLTRSTIGATGPASSRENQLPLIHRRPANDGANDLNILDLVVANRMRVVREDHEVGELASRDGAFDRLLARCVCAVQRVDPDGLIDGHTLIRAPRRPVPSRARDHA